MSVHRHLSPHAWNPTNSTYSHDTIRDFRHVLSEQPTHIFGRVANARIGHRLQLDRSTRLSVGDVFSKHEALYNLRSRYTVFNE